MLRVGVLASGGGTDLQSILDACDRHEIDAQVVCVGSNRKKAYALTRAQNSGIPSFSSKDENVIVAEFKKAGVELVVLAGYLAIVTDTLLEAFPNRVINIHPSLIPSFCGPGFYGMHVHEAVYARGVKLSGATVHFVSNEVDGGPIIYQEACDINDVTSAEEIASRVLEIEHRILPLVVGYFAKDRVQLTDGRAIVVKEER